jgi:hypothetical protein
MVILVRELHIELPQEWVVLKKHHFLGVVFRKHQLEAQCGRTAWHSAVSTQCRLAVADAGHIACDVV